MKETELTLSRPPVVKRHTSTDEFGAH